jgi:uncharacterized membrane protein
MIRKVYHVEFKKPMPDGKHFYFGSKMAIYSRFTVEQIGITYKYLCNTIKLDKEPYENNKVIIRLGRLITTMTDK